MSEVAPLMDGQEIAAKLRAAAAFSDDQLKRLIDQIGRNSENGVPSGPQARLRAGYQQLLEARQVPQTAGDNDG